MVIVSSLTGGYHPVEIGDIYNGRYRILRKLGWGHFSTVWLCRDIKLANRGGLSGDAVLFYRESRYAALKVVKSAKHYTEAALDEIDLLKKVASTNRLSTGWPHVVQLYESFRISGPHGNHMVMVFEVLGVNLLKPIVKLNYKGLPIMAVKSITKQVLLGVDYLHRECNIIHTDIKPENILFCVTNEKIKELASQVPLTRSSISNAPASKSKGSLPMTRNQKKRLKMKLKKTQELIEQDKSSMDIANPTMTATTTTTEDNITTNVIITDVGDVSSSQDHMESNGDNNNIQNENDSNEFDLPITVKIADLGNACWTHHHFTDDIQTRQYRCLEVLIGSEYGPPADIWSIACMTFELATGDYLFEPHSGGNYTRDEGMCA
jgi:serine/threonine protein kinase